METVEQEIEAEQAQAPAEAAPTEEVEAKPKRKKKEVEEIVEEKTYTIPLGKALIMPPRKRAPRAMHMIRAYIVKHMKVPTRAEEEDEEPPTLTITQELNERVWGRGIEKPPRKIRVRATKDKEGNVTVHLAEGA
jgi:large subunit ribosomal protein L31e